MDEVAIELRSNSDTAAAAAAAAVSAVKQD